MKRKLIMLFALLACLAIFPSMAQAAENDTIEVGGVELSSTSPYAKTDSEGTVTAATEEEHNISWDAVTDTLTLNNVTLKVDENEAITADVDTLTIALAGENSISVTKDAVTQDENHFAAIDNTGGGITVKNVDTSAPGSLKVTLDLDDTTNFSGSSAAVIHSESDFNNTSTLSLSATGESTVAYNIEGIIVAKTETTMTGPIWSLTDTIDAAFQNDGALIITINTKAEMATGIKTIGKEFVNTGSISVTAASTDDGTSTQTNYGIAMSGSSNSLEKTWNNSGNITLNVSTKSAENALGIMIANTQQAIAMTNENGGTVTLTVSSDSATADPNTTNVCGINLDSNKQITFANRGDLTVDADGLVNVYGICMTSYNENADLTNSGKMNLDCASSETGSSYGIVMFLNYISGEEAHHTNLTFEQGSDVEITTGSTGDCMAVLQQRCYVTAAAEGEGRDQIFFRDTVIDGEGSVYTEYQNAYGQHYYVSFLADNNGAPLSSLHISTAVQAMGVVLNSGALSLMVDDTATLTATVSPADVTDPTVTWTSSDSSVATVDENGKVTAVAPGTATITATTANGLKATCEVTVESPEPPYTGKYSYEIFTDVGDNGTLSVDRYATEGDKVTIDVSPDEAYLLEDLTITSGGKEVEVTDNGDGTFTFTMPSGDVEISATFAEDPDWTEPEPEPEPSTDVSEIFLDVAPNAWYKDAVQYAYDNGLMTGVSATEFAPDQTTTRAMIVSILARLESVTSASDAGFSDVDDEWFATAVNWAASENIVAGFEDGSFRPNAAITREQLAAILMNYAAYKGEDVSARAALDAYSDADAVSSWAAETMSWAVAEGYISGMTADELQPQGNATRAQLAAILERYLSK